MLKLAMRFISILQFQNSTIIAIQSATLIKKTTDSFTNLNRL
jgi:hypothetical protein